MKDRKGNCIIKSVNTLALTGLLNTYEYVQYSFQKAATAKYTKSHKNALSLRGRKAGGNSPKYSLYVFWYTHTHAYFPYLMLLLRQLIETHIITCMPLVLGVFSTNRPSLFRHEEQHGEAERESNTREDPFQHETKSPRQRPCYITTEESSQVGNIYIIHNSVFLIGVIHKVEGRFLSSLIRELDLQCMFSKCFPCNF